MFGYKKTWILVRLEGIDHCVFLFFFLFFPEESVYYIRLFSQ